MTLRYKFIVSAILVMAFTLPDSFSQKGTTGINYIKSRDLETHVSFLASPVMRGRQNGKPELDIALNYIVSQAKLLGLKPANGNSYYQPYVVMEKMIDQDKSSLTIITDDKDSVRIHEPMRQLFPMGAGDFEIEGEVIFGGYGIKSEKYNYNDLADIQPEGKILLIMSRAPLSEDGSKYHFEEPVWSSFMSIQSKISSLLFSKAKAILVVSDPKSGYSSIDEQYPELAHELISTKYLKGSKPMIMDMPAMPRIIFVHRSVADELFSGTGYSLEGLQKTIDSLVKPSSFVIEGKKIKITEASVTREITLNNVAAWIEGSHPSLKKEVVVFSCHADHIGSFGDLVYPGADDNASGCAAILEIAGAFQSLDTKPQRSLLFLWFSGEEIGLFGSQSYVRDPLFPLKNTIADFNIDMIGRVRGIADSTSDTPMTGPDGVYLITGNQSSELVQIADDIDKKYRIDFDYSLSGRNHPLQLFSRSDHFNFVKQDIPVLFFSTGLHSDYHKTGDVIEKIDFKKMEMITRMIYEIGLTVANKKERIVVNNPYSKW